MKKCGYSFWGYLGDVKYDREGNIASTPDGNAFYSWCIIRELQKRGYEVTQIMPDRDEKGYSIMGDNLFSSWIESERIQAYTGTKKSNLWIIIDSYKENIEQYSIGDLIKQMKTTILNYIGFICQEMEFILHEFRMWIPGRNDYDSIFEENWQPDYLIQECLFEYCCIKHKRLILFDLDYKLDSRIYRDLREKGCPVVIFELGTKWQRTYSDIEYGAEIRNVYIPFDFDNIDYFSDCRSARNYNLVYVGNRYERDWCIDKYIPDNLDKCVVYGNWLEGDRDSKRRWPNLYFGNFGKRLQTKHMRDVYVNSIATILLAKKEYCEFEFMTARIIEAIFYGTVPLFIEEYGEKTIKRYAGDYAEFLTVRSAMDVYKKIEELRRLSGDRWIEIIVEYMRDRLKFMDVKYFVNAIEEVK